MSGEFLPKVVLVHGQGQEPNWQRFNVQPSSDLNLDWSQVRTVRVAFEFAAGWMYQDSWAVEWDDLELQATP